MNLRSISFRLVVWYTSLLTGIFVVLGSLFYLALLHFVEQDTQQHQINRARQIATTLLADTEIAQSGEPLFANEIRTIYAPEINDRFIRVSRDDGHVIYLSSEPSDDSFDPKAVPALAPESGAEFGQKFVLPGDKCLLVGVYRVAGKNGHDYTVEVGVLLNSFVTMLDHLFFQLAMSLPLAVVIIAIGGWLLVRQALQPVAEITRKAEQITQHNTGERMPIAHTGDELEKLSLSLNRMIARLDDALRNSTRFVADASHELRTPLTILHGELEILTADPKINAETREQVCSMLEEVARLSKIVEQLFTLSRLDAGEAQTEWKPFDLAELARTTAEQMSLLAEDKHISIECDARQTVMIEGDRARLKQVIVNLLDNAIKYTPNDGAVQLCVNALSGYAILEVADNGIGISAEALPHVFERFFRVDQTRSNDSGSAGLGLSIVKSICTAHGALVDVQSNLRNGSCFVVKFPISRN